MEELVRKHSGLLEYVARGILQDQSLVENCISRVWLRAVERQDNYDPERGLPVSTWLAAPAGARPWTACASSCRQAPPRRLLSEALADDSPSPSCCSGASARKSQRRSPS